MESFFSYYEKHNLKEPTFYGMALVNKLEAENALLPAKKRILMDYFRAIRIFKSVKNFRFIRLVYINLAEHYQIIGKSSKMIEYAEKAAELTEQTNLNERQDKLYNMLYIHHKEKKEFVKAFKYLELFNLEKENKKKQEAITSLLKKQIHQLTKQQPINLDGNSNITYFHDSQTITLNQSKTIYDIKVLDITIVEVDKNGFAGVSTVYGKIYKTTMPFTSVMELVNSTYHKQYFFYSNKRRQAVNLIYKKEINKNNRTITLEFSGTRKTIAFTVRQYYELLKAEKSKRS